MGQTASASRRKIATVATLSVGVAALATFATLTTVRKRQHQRRQQLQLNLQNLPENQLNLLKLSYLGKIHVEDKVWDTHENWWGFTSVLPRTKHLTNNDSNGGNNVTDADGGRHKVITIVTHESGIDRNGNGGDKNQCGIIRGVFDIHFFFFASYSQRASWVERGCDDFFTKDY